MEEDTTDKDALIELVRRIEKCLRAIKGLPTETTDQLPTEPVYVFISLTIF